MGVKLALGEIPEDVKEKVEKDWKSGKIKELMREIHKGLKKMNREKLENLLRGKRVSLSSTETNSQKPEEFTKDYVLKPLLEYLGYKPDKEARKKRASGTRRYPDYRAKDSYGNWVLIEAEPLHVNLREKEKGINQVDDWMDSETRIGFATNGLNWLLHYYKETVDIEEIIELDLTPFFQKIWFNGFVEDEQIKELFQKLYYYFSKKWIKIAIDEVISAITISREEITKKFYKQFIRIVFGVEEKGTGKNIKIENVGKGVIDYVKAPPNTDDLTKRKFAILFMNRLIFIVFLENINLIPPRALETLYEKWKKSGSPHSFYDEYLKPLFYGVLNTEPENREEHINKVEIFREIPYLNGGLFRKNKEEEGFSISNDDIIKKAIDLLEGSELTIKGNGGRTLNPDILGYIYEKVINILTTKGRKGLGAYYTPEEITTYIAKNTIEPTVVEKIKKVLKNHSGFDLNFNTISEVLDVNKPKTRDGDILREILDEINKIRILDPAVGSGHFLISALKILTDIKKRIYNIMREPINMYNIKLEIVLNNLHGVDIDGSAVEIAKLRLWLALIENIDVDAVKRRDVVLPNVEYNIRQGNSLIGWVDEDLEVTINFAYTEKMEGLFKGLKTFSGKERKKINKAEELLRSSKGNTLENYINAYHLIYEIYRESVGEVASNLKDILEDIRSSIYRDINGAYADYLLKKIYKRATNKKKKEFTEKLREKELFHWRVDFGWIMEDGGFDVIIGNPPYGNLLSDIEKNVCKSYTSYTGEIASVFVERFVPLNREGGYLSFIITFAVTFNKNLSGMRKTVYDNYDECRISTFDRDRCRFFDGMTQSVSIMLCKKRIPEGGCKFYTSRMFRVMPDINNIEFQLANNLLLGEKVGVSFAEKHRLPKIGEKNVLNILNKIIQNNKTIGNAISPTGEKIWIRTSGNYWYNAWDREPYQNTKIKDIAVNKRFKSFLIILMNSSTYYLWFRVYGDGRDMNTDIMKTLPIPSEEKINKVEFLLNHLNDLLMKFMFYNFDEEHNRFNTSNIKLVIDICDIVIGKLYGFSKNEIDFILNFEDVIRGGKKIPDIFFTIMDYLMLSYHFGQRTFDGYKIIDPLVYELYFKEKFHEDGLYPEPKNYLLNAVAKHLKPINYDRWAELYWKKQLNGNLTKEEGRELKKLEKENLKTIEGVYKSLKNDEEVQKWIEKIKSHEWVKIIEGEK